jgi:DNA-binding MarR family transcriptional regulator
LRKRQKHSIGGRAVQESRLTFRHSNGIAKGVAKNLAALPLAPSGLKTTQRAILAEIGRSEPATVGSLADALVMDAGGLAHTLKPLTREKLVTIAVDPQDRRNRLISLTRLGRSKLRESDALWEAAQRSFEAAFGATESEDLRVVMQFLAANDFTETFETALASTGR